MWGFEEFLFFFFREEKASELRVRVGIKFQTVEASNDAAIGFGVQLSWGQKISFRYGSGRAGRTVGGEERGQVGGKVLLKCR